MTELNIRQHEFFAAVLRATKQQNSVVNLSEVCLALRMGQDECAAVVRWAEKAGLLNGLGNDQAILTASGRELAEGFLLTRD